VVVVNNNNNILHDFKTRIRLAVQVKMGFLLRLRWNNSSLLLMG
jgi:hypothetical protein